LLLTPGQFVDPTRLQITEPNELDGLSDAALDLRCSRFGDA
jgi:hypothetical protein